VLGSRAAKYPNVISRAYEEGHQIASHTYNHKDLTKLNASGLEFEIQATNEAIYSAIGKYPSAMRPPYGARNSTVISAAGVPVVLWSVDPLDWKYRDSATVHQNVISRVEDGSIVLMHDIHATTVGAVQAIIDSLRAGGYELVTVEELMAVRGGAEAGKVYTKFVP
jgi:peptidoglycan/xylan/chitin deacetylase (PgdA/CDA1 family)